jgi:hypothetical protein
MKIYLHVEQLWNFELQTLTFFIRKSTLISYSGGTLGASFSHSRKFLSYSRFLQIFSHYSFASHLIRSYTAELINVKRTVKAYGGQWCYSSTHS